jgi:hypothetical protein
MILLNLSINLGGKKTMKKVLSVLLAAAMVMGMSVSTFAADKDFYAPSAKPVDNEVKVEWLAFHDVVVKNADGKYDYKTYDQAYKELEAGDELYFTVCDNWYEEPTALKSKADKDWVIKVKNSEYVEDAEFFYDEKGVLNEGALFVKITLADDFDHYAEDGVDFYFYIYDTARKESSDKAFVKYSFDAYPVVYLCDTDCAKDHKLDRDDVECKVWDVDGHDDDLLVHVEDPAIYVLCDCKNCYTTSQEVMFHVDYNKTDVYFTGKMIPGEEYLTQANTKFDKALTKAYDVDMFVLTIDTEMKVDAIFEAKKDNKVVLEVIDGELYEVESEFVEKYEVIEDEILTKGYKVENIDNGTFVLVDADADLDWEDTTRKEVVEAPVADDKANPSTGANDFVGAAVALAVVSVAAAGALAFKK